MTYRAQPITSYRILPPKWRIIEPEDRSSASYHLKQADTAVVEVLDSVHGISSDRLSAQGVGPLAPLESNGTEEGRSKNRRVQLVLM